MKDVLGALLSTLCLCHCIMMPVAVLYVGVGIQWLFEESLWAHLSLIGPVILLAIWNFPIARRIHKHALPSVLAGLGVLLLLLSLVTHGEWELTFGVVGSLSVLIAHLSNYSLLRRVQYQQK